LESIHGAGTQQLTRRIAKVTGYFSSSKTLKIRKRNPHCQNAFPNILAAGCSTSIILGASQFNKREKVNK
jgi:hypothetical protein